LGDGVLALMSLLPLLIFLVLPVVPADKKLASESFRDFFRDVGALIRKPSVRIMILFFVLPSATFSLTNVLGGMGLDYGASEHFVGLVGGAGEMVAGVIGALLIPGFLKRIEPKTLYLLIGTLGALFTLLLIALPHTQPVYGLAVVGENIFQSAGFSVGYAIILLEIGKNNALAATQFAVLNAAQTVPMAYMEAVDGNAYGFGKAAGLYLADAGISLIACALMAVLLCVIGRRRRTRRLIGVLADGTRH
jgi:PAT family beta-lactamase induction signal transducer AmpG